MGRRGPKTQFVNCKNHPERPAKCKSAALCSTCHSREYRILHRGYDAEWHKKRWAEDPDYYKNRSAKNPCCSWKAQIKRYERLIGRPRPSSCEIPGCNSTHKIHFDHCHKTGKPRGWICQGCNQALGMVRDKPELLRALADYLERRSNRPLVMRPRLVYDWKTPIDFLAIRKLHG